MKKLAVIAVLYYDSDGEIDVLMYDKPSHRIKKITIEYEHVIKTKLAGVSQAKVWEGE